MKSAAFKAIVENVSRLTQSQLARLAATVAARKSTLESKQAFSQHQPTGCPSCSSPALTRYGTQNGTQRYRCSGCGKTCTAFTQTPLCRLQEKHRFSAYADCLDSRVSLRKAAENMGFSLSRAFRWRHAFLSKPVEHQPQSIAGVLEIDQTLFRLSKKGERGLKKPRSRGPNAWKKEVDTVPKISVLVGRVRGQVYIVDKVLADSSADEVVATLKPVVDSDSTFLTMDSHTAFATLERELDVCCFPFNQSRPSRKNNHHVQSVNSYHQGLKTWINGVLRGVATKYLPHYLAWQRLHALGKNLQPSFLYIGSGLGSQLTNLK